MCNIVSFNPGLCFVRMSADVWSAVRRQAAAKTRRCGSFLLNRCTVESRRGRFLLEKNQQKHTNTLFTTRKLRQSLITFIIKHCVDLFLIDVSRCYGEVSTFSNVLAHVPIRRSFRWYNYVVSFGFHGLLWLSYYYRCREEEKNTLNDFHMKHYIIFVFISVHNDNHHNTLILCWYD